MKLHFRPFVHPLWPAKTSNHRSCHDKRIKRSSKEHCWIINHLLDSVCVRKVNIHKSQYCDYMACYAFARITSPARILSFRLNATKSEIFLGSVQQHLLSMSKHLQTKRVVLIRLIKKLSNMARARANSYRLPLWVTSERENKLVVIDSISYYELLVLKPMPPPHFRLRPPPPWEAGTETHTQMCEKGDDGERNQVFSSNT